MYAPQLEKLRSLEGFKFDAPRAEFFDSPGGQFFISGRPMIGIRAQDTEDGKGAKVLDVSDDSPAEKAGIREDDVITSFDGKKINNADELSAAAKEARTKTSVEIKYNRDGKSQTAEIKIPKKLKTTNL
jgi:serine protease Do